MRITKVYTRTGDAAKQGLPEGSRSGKTVCALKPCGTVDELNASVGLVRAMNAEGGSASPPPRNSRRTCVGSKINCSMSGVCSPPRRARAFRICRKSPRLT